MVTECAFGRLKGRWRILYRKGEVNQHSLKVNVLACIVLHNIYIEKENNISRKLDSHMTKITINENVQKN